ncbi:MAG: hypothetical protein KAT30_05235, partial [Candidatus Krumholzibacteria bacterium]|nr:hypothetical protein [Candidatus Krumholzibacteria bacterium]
MPVDKNDPVNAESSNARSWSFSTVRPLGDTFLGTAKSCWRSGRTRVNRHSSFFVVGKPCSANRSAAATRMSLAHDGALFPTGLDANFFKPAIYVS